LVNTQQILQNAIKHNVLYHLKKHEIITIMEQFNVAVTWQSHYRAILQCESVSSTVDR